MNTSKNSQLLNWLMLFAVIAIGSLVMEWAFRNSSLSDRLGWASEISITDRVARIKPKSKDTIRILGLGDSFTIYRDSQNKNYLRVMENLAKNDGHHVEVINLGRPGTGLGFYESVARKFTDVVKPDLITIGIYLGDDIPSSFHPPMEFEAAPPPNFKDFIKRKSQLLNFGFRLLKQFSSTLHSGHYQEILEMAQRQHGVSEQTLNERHQNIDPQIIAMAESDAINPWDLVNGMILPTQYKDLITQDKKSTAGRKIEAMFSMLKRIHQFGIERNIPVVFITIPIRLQVSENDQQYFKSLGVKIGKDLIGKTPLQTKISQMMKSNELFHFDLLPALISANKKLFIPLDTHLNNAGQVVAGTHLYQYLKQKNLIGQFNGIQ